MATYQQEQALGIERAQTASAVSANGNMDMEASRGEKKINSENENSERKSELSYVFFFI